MQIPTNSHLYPMYTNANSIQLLQLQLPNLKSLNSASAPKLNITILNIENVSPATSYMPKLKATKDEMQIVDPSALNLPP